MLIGERELEHQNIYKIIEKTGFMERIQSASSINTFKQCKRKYYYNYIERLPTMANIHQIMGNVVHSVLEQFFRIDISKVSRESYEIELNAIALDLLRKNWIGRKNEIMKLEVDREVIESYLDEAKSMVGSWIQRIIENIDKDDIINSFNEQKPVTEKEIISKKLMLRGYLDAVYNKNGKIEILDYKTSNSDELKEDYKLQLAVYALLYEDKYGKKPERVGISFLKYGERYVDVDEGLLDLAKKEVEMIHKNTKSERIEDYPKSPGPLCKWSTGKCDFYDICKPFEE